VASGTSLAAVLDTTSECFEGGVEGTRRGHAVGIFWEPLSTERASLRSQFREALMASPPSKAEADSRADDLARASTTDSRQSLQVGRLLIAMAIVIVLVGAGIWTAAVGLSDPSKSIFGIATTAFGVVVGLLGGEKKSS
jgi:hypothetical protein